MKCKRCAKRRGNLYKRIEIYFDSTTTDRIIKLRRTRSSGGKEKFSESFAGSNELKILLHETVTSGPTHRLLTSFN